MVIYLGIEYVLYAVPFSIPDICKMDTKLTKSICNLPTSTRNIFTQLPKEAFGMETYFLPPRYVTILNEQSTQRLDDPRPLRDIHCS